MNKEYDVVVIGAGILGASTAYHMLNAHPDMKILVIDREMVAQGNTSKSVAMVRDTFTSQPSFALAASTIAAFKEIDKETDGAIALNRMMYLWLFTSDQTAKNKPAINRLLGAGVDVELLSADKLAEYASCMRLTPDDEESLAYGIPPIDSGLLCRNCYALDPIAVTQYYIDKFRAAGGETLLGKEVIDFVRRPVTPLCYEGDEIPGQPFSTQQQQAAGVKLADGTEIKAETTIIAAGAWSRELTDKFGKGSLISPKKRQWFYVEGNDLAPLLELPAFGNEDGCLPFTILPQGIYMKASKEGGFYVALADDVGREISLDTTPERQYFIDDIHPFIKGYFPAFEAVTIKAMDAGSYCYDEIYRTPVVDWIHDGIMLVSGASGSGIMKADAIGRVATHRQEVGRVSNMQMHNYLQLPGDLIVDIEDYSIRGRSRIEPEQLVI